MNDLLELFEEFEYHLLNDNKPSNYFRQVIKEKKYKDCYPVKILLDLQNVDQNPKHHPEGNVFNHTMEVVDNAANFRNQSSNEREFMWATFLHDLGKITATRMRKGRLTTYDHDKQGEVIAKSFLETFSNDSEFIYRVSKLVRWHMQPFFISKKLPFATVDEMIEETSISEIALLSICDRTGKGPITKEREKEECLIVLDFILDCYDKITDEEEIKKADYIIKYLKTI